ncbi:MAG TPA: hypothetical protein VEK11_15765 [Thermoanaerobaculia bacterium]|nr:hypothetical protein [Thermoanaerobaculia bacterium]
MAFAEQNKWVIIEVNQAGDVFFAPEKLDLPAGWVGDIIWYVFTPGWELSTDGVVFPPDSGFNGIPQPDETRDRCWSTPASNNGAATFHYTVAVHPVNDPSKKVYRDPVVENDPPVPAPLQKRRPARRRESSRRQNAS